MTFTLPGPPECKATDTVAPKLAGHGGYEFYHEVAWSKLVPNKYAISELALSQSRDLVQVAKHVPVISREIRSGWRGSSILLSRCTSTHVELGFKGFRVSGILCTIVDDVSDFPTLGYLRVPCLACCTNLAASGSSGMRAAAASKAWRLF